MEQLAFGNFKVFEIRRKRLKNFQAMTLFAVLCVKNIKYEKANWGTKRYLIGTL